MSFEFWVRIAWRILTPGVGLLAMTAGAADPAFDSHPPMRPLPIVSPAPLDAPPAGPILHVSPTGDDTADGSLEKPWRTLAHATRQLAPGTTLYLRGGTYYEQVALTRSGADGQPIVIRSYPGELAVIDGGLREFAEDPAAAWVPATGGAPDEYVSTRTYPGRDRRLVPRQFIDNAWEPMFGVEDERPLALGHFADSMVPLHGYRTLADLRSDVEFWGGKNQESMYCGPGLWYDRTTGRIHVRLGHNRIEGLGEHAYRGQTDPRRLPLVVALGFGEDLVRLNGIRHVHLQHLVIRGATGSPAINLYGSTDLVLSGLTVYGGFPGLLVNACQRLQVTHCAFRGLAAPWSSRASMKYRGTPTYVIVSQNNQPVNDDMEFAWNEFTDGHDFAWLRYINHLQFHHNLVENFNDDGVEVGAKKRDHSIYVWQNRLSRCNMTFVAHEIDKDESPAAVDPGSGVYIFRNIVDLRGGIYSSPGATPDPTGAFLHGDARLCSDHGSPIWANYYFYHNTVLRPTAPWRAHYALGMGAQGIVGNQRWVFNNIFVTQQGLPGLAMTYVDGYQLDGNLHWGMLEGPAFQGDFFAKFRQSKDFEQSRQTYAPGWTANDRFADPRFVDWRDDWRQPANLALRPDSPALEAGVPIPTEWPDPLRAADAGQPDLGAIPLGVEPWGIGVNGRFSLFGELRLDAPELRR